MGKGMNRIGKEATQGKRFEFGWNWQKFLKVLDEERIREAEESLKVKLNSPILNGKTFLDIGSGSGLFSLAARRLGAKVHSFDYDPKSVACTTELKHLFYNDDANWVVEEGSVLDVGYMESLGKFDIVYSWGVLHHTGAMWQALGNATIPVADGGKLFVAIYNDQGGKSKRWKMVKSLYCSSKVGKILLIAIFFPYFFLSDLADDLFHARNILKHYRDYKIKRGMSVLTDWFDWLGGYPFDVAKPEQVFEFLRNKGYQLDMLKTCRGEMGNNEFVFTKLARTQENSRIDT
jgi:2-polyprenyl-3-methyl-5-hydroxy-6-metoxy-1,4-benzoquinol methylase